jgi:AcrR family transcriptional regulator
VAAPRKVSASNNRAAVASRAGSRSGGGSRQVPRRLGRPVASDGDERRRLIIQVARRLFAQSGYLGTTNRAIADKAGITTGAIYHYFPSKLDVYLAVFEETDEVILARYREVTSDASLNFDERIAAILEVSPQLNVEDETLAAFIITAAFEANHNQDLMPTYQKHDRTIMRFFEQLVDQGVAEGVVSPGAGREAVLDALRVLTLGLTLFSVRVKDPERHRRAAAAIVKSLRGELFPATPARRRRAAAR